MTVLSSSVLLAQETEPPPYLYYYSRMLGGIIIERADGTDSRLIGEDVIPPDLIGINGPGWSPSGEYFAAYRSGYEGYGFSEPYLTNIGGEQRISELQQMRVTFGMEWSPNGEDVLLFVGNTSNDNFNRERHYWLLDPNTNRILAKFSGEFDSYDYGASYYRGQIIWNEEDIYAFMSFKIITHLPDVYSGSLCTMMALCLKRQ